MGIKSSVRRRNVKGFTVVEMVVVFAIIGILAATLSLVITTFANDARRESADTEARKVSQSFQSLLTEYEISGKKVNEITYKDSTGALQNLFCAASANPAVIFIRGDSSDAAVSTAAIADNTDAYPVITQYFEPGFDGSFTISMDPFEYSVNYVLYSDATAADTGTLGATIMHGPLQMANREAQKDYLEDTGYVIGCYPYSDDLSS